MGKKRYEDLCRSKPTLRYYPPHSIPRIKPVNKMKKQYLISVLLLLACAISANAQGDDIFKRKNISKTMLKVAGWQLQNPRHDLTDWTNGAFYAGVFAAYETTKSPELLKAMI